MRVLLDEQLPRRLARHLVGHDVRTVQQRSWVGLKNGVLLSEAEAAGFSVLVTGDQDLEHQQNLTKRKLGVVVLGAVNPPAWSRVNRPAERGTPQSKRFMPPGVATQYLRELLKRCTESGDLLLLWT